MLTGRTEKAGMIKSDDLEIIRRWLVGGIQDTEKLILKYNKKNKFKELASLNGLYIGMMEYITKQLYDISTAIIEKTNVHEVKSYKTLNQSPPNFQDYVNASENLANVIMHDILSQPDSAHAQLAIERWVIISRMCYLLNDLLSCATIVTALGIRAIDRSGLRLELSPVAHATLLYYEQLFTKHDWVLDVQRQCVSRGEQIVPYLHSLPNVLERTETKMNLDRAKEKVKTQELDSVRRSYTTIIKPMRYHQTDQMDSILTLLYKNKDDDLYDDYTKKADAITTAVASSDIKVSHIMYKMNLYNGLQEKLLYQLSKLVDIKENYDYGRPFIFINDAITALFDARLSEEVKYIKFSILVSNFKQDFDKPLKSLTKKISAILLLIIETRPSKVSNDFVMTPRRHQSAGEVKSSSPRRHKRSKDKLETKEKPDNAEIKELKKGDEKKKELPEVEEAQVPAPDAVKEVERTSPNLEPAKEEVKTLSKSQVNAEEQEDKKAESPRETKPETQPEVQTEVQSLASPSAPTLSTHAKLREQVKLDILKSRTLPIDVTPPSSYRDEITQVASSRVVSSHRQTFQSLIEKHATEQKAASNNVRALLSDRYLGQHARVFAKPSTTSDDAAQTAASGSKSAKPVKK